MNVSKISTMTLFRRNNVATKNDVPVKTDVTFRGKEKVASKSLEVGAALAASVLFANSIKEIGDPSWIINEYYENECNKYPKKIDDISLSRFTPEEKFEILHRADEINANKESFQKIIIAKNADSSFRFSANDSLAIFDEVGDKIKKFPRFFAMILDVKDKEGNARFNADDCIILMHDAEILSKNKNILKEEFEQNNLNTADCKQKILNTIYAKEADELKNLQAAKIEADLKADAEKKQKSELLAQKEAEKLEAAKQRAEARAIRQAEANKLKTQKMEEQKEFWDKKTEWVSPACVFEKVNNAVNTQSPLVLASGEILPNEMRDKIAHNIRNARKKAMNIINLRYDNQQPVFNERECCEILSDLDSYYYLDSNSGIKFLNDDGTPFFDAEQCREILKLKKAQRRLVGNFIFETGRRFSSDEIEEFARTHSKSYDAIYEQKFNEQDENGNYKYTVAEAEKEADRIFKEYWTNRKPTF